ncbi:hypothetical protein [Lysobacter sp. N42]|uniref:DUF7010 family protein n=1 Tax=Lysobacter sp. N42 TaxID=2545719 RepID=UPI00104E8C77|nr:hypothetical protein [Lysobacter sp. N42]TCZ82829.1 hypothetical protein EYQ95_22530 [Lysobacter sp. N42]
MAEAAPHWAGQAPLGAARWELVRVTRRGVGMTLAAALFWLAMAGVSAFAGLSPGVLGAFFVVGVALVYPGGWALNRAFGGDLTARGSAFRGLVGAITAGQLLGAPLVVALLLRDPALVAFALAAMLGAHFLPYGWLYRAPGYHALGLASIALATPLQAVAGARANVAIALAMAVLYLAATLHVHRQNQRDGLRPARARAP